GTWTGLDDPDGAGPEALQNLLNGAQKLRSLGTDFRGKAKWMSGPKIAFDGGHMIAELSSMRCGVGGPSPSAAFFIDPRDHTQRPLRFVMELLHQLRRLHREGYPGRVIDCARPQVP